MIEQIVILLIIFICLLIFFLKKVDWVTVSTVVGKFERAFGCFAEKSSGEASKGLKEEAGKSYSGESYEVHSEVPVDTATGDLRDLVVDIGDVGEGGYTGKVGDKVEYSERVRKFDFSRITPRLTVPQDFKDLVSYLSDKYMLINLTISTYEGLPVASNSPTPDEDSALAPEILRLLRDIVESDKILISGGNKKVLVFNVGEDLIVHARVNRDLSLPEIEEGNTELFR